MSRINRFMLLCLLVLSLPMPAAAQEDDNIIDFLTFEQYGEYYVFHYQEKLSEKSYVFYFTQMYPFSVHGGFTLKDFETVHEALGKLPEWNRRMKDNHVDQVTKVLWEHDGWDIHYAWDGKHGRLELNNQRFDAPLNTEAVVKNPLKAMDRIARRIATIGERAQKREKARTKARENEDKARALLN